MQNSAAINHKRPKPESLAKISSFLFCTGQHHAAGGREHDPAHAARRAAAPQGALVIINNRISRNLQWVLIHKNTYFACTHTHTHTHTRTHAHTHTHTHTHTQVLDLCAAPGSKTAQLIEMLHANDDAVPGEGPIAMFSLDLFLLIVLLLLLVYCCWIGLSFTLSSLQLVLLSPTTRI